MNNKRKGGNDLKINGCLVKKNKGELECQVINNKRKQVSYCPF